MCGIGLTKQDLPEWIKRVFDREISFVPETDMMTLQEHRQSLPIYILKDNLIKVNPFLELADILFSTLNFVAD
jgi:ATP-dependent RNA helicase DHX8/PRP22